MMRVIELILPQKSSTAMFKGVHSFAYMMLFSKMLDEFRDAGLIMKAKRQYEEDEAARKQREEREAKSGRNFQRVLNAKYDQLIYTEMESPEDALEEMVNILNEQFAELINYEEDDDHEGISNVDFPIITPAQSQWLIDKYKKTKDAMTRADGESKFSYDIDELKPSVDSNSHAFWLGLLHGKHPPHPAKSVEQLLRQKHPLGATWHNALESSRARGDYKLDREGLARHRANIDTAREQKRQGLDYASSGFAPQLERNIPEKGSKPKPFSQEEMEAQSARSKEGYEDLFSRVRIKPGKREIEGDKPSPSGTKLTPIGKFNDLANNISERMKEDAEMSQKKVYDEEYLLDAIDERDEMVTSNTKILKPLERRYNMGKKGPTRRRADLKEEIENFKLSAALNNDRFESKQASIRERLRYEALRERFTTLQDALNNHAKDALQTRNIGTIGGKKGRVDNIITPALKQIATLLKLPCKDVNAPDVMNEPLVSMVGQKAREAASSSYLQQLAKDVMEHEGKLHNTLKTAMSANGSLFNRFGGDLGHLGFGGKDAGGISRQGGRGADKTSFGDTDEEIAEDRTWQEGDVEGHDYQDTEATHNAPAQGLLGSDMGLAPGGAHDKDTAEGAQAAAKIREMARHVRRGTESSKETPHSIGQNWHILRDELMAKVHRGEMTQSQAKHQLTEKYYNSQEADEAHNAFLGIGDLDEIDEVKDKNHPLHGRTPEGRKQWADDLLSVIFGTAGLIASTSLRFESKAEDGSQWHHNDSNRVAVAGDLKKLFHPPTAKDFSDERVDDREAREADLEHISMEFDERSAIANRVNNLGLDWNDVRAMTMKMLDKHAKKIQAGSKEPLALSEAFREAMKNITLSATNRISTQELTESELKALTQQIKRLEEDIYNDKQMANIFSETTDEMKQRRAQLRELKDELNQQKKAGGKPRMWFANQVVNSVQQQALEKENDEKWLNKTRQQTHSLFKGDIDKKKDCDGCVGSKNHFMNLDRNESYTNVHEYIKAKRGQSPFTHMRVPMPDIRFLPKEHETQTSLETIANEMGLGDDWERSMKHRHESTIRDMLMEKLLYDPQACAKISEKYNLNTRNERRLPVGPASMSAADLALMSVIFPDDYRKHQANEQSHHIRNQQRKSITEAVKLFQTLQEGGFKSRTNYKSGQPLNHMSRKTLMDEVWDYAGGRAATDAQTLHDDAKKVHKIVKNRFSEFTDDNGEAWARYSSLRDGLEDMHKDEDKMSSRMLSRLQKYVKHTNWENRFNDEEDITIDDAREQMKEFYQSKMKEASLTIRIPQKLEAWRFGGGLKLNTSAKEGLKGAVVGIKSNTKGKSVGKLMSVDGGPLEVLNGIYNTINQYKIAANEQGENVKELRKKVISVGSSALGAMVRMMPDIIQQQKNESNPQEFIDYMMKKHYTEDNGLPKRTVIHAGQRDATRLVNRSDKSKPFTRYEGTPIINDVPMGDESLWTLYPGGPSLRHGADNNLGSIFGHKSSLFSRPSIEDLSEIPEIINRMQEYGFNHEFKDEKEMLTSAQAAKSLFSDMFPDAEVAQAKEIEDDDGLISEKERRRRNHSDMTVNDDKRDDENKLGTSTLCGYCRGHGSVSKDRLANYYSVHNKDLRGSNNNDPLMKDYISQNARPASTPSFDHHKEQHGDDALDDQQHWSYACPDCEHDDNTVRGGKVSDGLCNHCLGRGEIDPDDSRAMNVLMNERSKHMHHLGDHPPVESLVHAARATKQSQSFIKQINELLKGDTPLIQPRGAKGDENIEETYDHLNKLFADFDIKDMLPEEMFFEGVKQGDFPNVMSPQEHKNALHAAQVKATDIGHRKSIGEEWKNRPVELEDDTDAISDAMSKIPKQSVQDIVDGTHKKGLTHYLDHMMKKLDKYDADDETKAKAQEIINNITEHAIHNDADSSLQLGNNSPHGKNIIQRGIGTVDVNALWHDLQGIVNKQFRKQITLTKDDPRGMEISQLTTDDEDNIKNIFSKDHTFAHQPLVYHKGRMMSQYEIAHYDNKEGMGHQVTNPHDVENWFARNSNPKAVAKRLAEWKGGFGKLKSKMGLTWEETSKKNEKRKGYWDSDEEKGTGIYSPHQDSIAPKRDKSDIMGAFMRRGPTALKAHEKSIKRATQFTKRIEEMRDQKISPLMNNKKIIPPNQELMRLVEELGGQTPLGANGGQEVEGPEFHPSLHDFKDEAFEWLRPRPPNPDDPDGYREPTKGEVPMHLRLESEIEHHLKTEFEQYIEAKALKYFININADAGEEEEAYSYPMEDGSMQLLTAEMVKQMNKPTEQGGNPKEMSKIKNEVEKVIKGAKKGTKGPNANTYNFSGDEISRVDYMEKRKSEVQQHPDGPQEIEWGDYAKNPWDGLYKIVHRYFENYDKHPAIQRDNKLIDFGHKMYWASIAPNMSIEAMLKRHGVENSQDLQSKLQDPDFAKELDLIQGLCETQNPSWKASPPVLRGHIDTMSHIKDLKDSTWQPKHGTQEVPLMQPAPMQPPKPWEKWEKPYLSPIHGRLIKPLQPQISDVRPQRTPQQQQIIDNPPAPIMSQQEQQQQQDNS